MQIFFLPQPLKNLRTGGGLHKANTEEIHLGLAMEDWTAMRY